MPLVVVLAVVLAACGGSPSARSSVNEAVPSPTKTSFDANSVVGGPRPGHPNLLVIETDDMRWDDLRFMPNVRRLIEQRGLDFENSFAPYPLCCPSRASFLSGKYTHNHHVYGTENPYAFASFDDSTTIATQLQGAGYQTALIGKYLNNYGQQRIRSTGAPSLDYVPPGWTRWLAGSDHIWPINDPRYGGGTYSYFKLVQNIDGHIHSWPNRYSTDVLADQTRSVLHQFEGTGKPWFVWWTPVAPHHGSPIEPDDPAPTRTAKGFLEKWDTPARPDWVKGHFDAMVTHGAGTPPNHPAEADISDKPNYLRRLPPLTAAEKRAETTVTRQRGESLYVLDVQIGRTLAELSRSGQLKNTIIFFTSDNGYYLGEHRKRQGKITLHEPSLRVPLLAVGPGIPQGRRYDPVSTIDMASTLAAYAGTTMPGADGQSLVPLIEQGDRGWNRPVVTEAMMTGGRYGTMHDLGPSPLSTRGLRLGRWKLTRYATGETELYDLLTDPLEQENLASVPADADILKALDQLWASYANCTGTAQCSAPLPPRWRLSPQQEQALTDHEIATTNSYYGN